MRFNGWRHIFYFNFIQHIKSKAFIISTAVISFLLILAVLAMNFMPLIFKEENFDPSLTDGSETENPDDKEAISALYVHNETDFPMFDLSSLQSEKIKCYELSREAFDKKCEEIANGDNKELAILISPVKNENKNLTSVSLSLFRPKNEEVISERFSERFVYRCSYFFKEALLRYLGVSQKDLGIAQIPIDGSVYVYGEQDISRSERMLRTLITALLSTFLFTFIISNAQSVANSIAQEKTSRVIELLITSVRPLAIIAGKILAMMTAAIIQLLIFTGVSAATFMISLPLGVFSQKKFLASSGVPSDFTKLKDEAFEALPGLFNPISIFVIILIMLLGFLFYSMLAGIIGAGVSRSEDLIPALQSFSMIALAGFFLSYIPAVSNLKDTNNAMMTFSRFFPLSSPFSLPSAILMGDLSPLEIVAAVFALLVLTFLAALLVAKVYENVILYSGSLLKLSDILKMARNK